MSATETREREDTRYPQIIRALCEPWAIDESTLSAIAELVVRREAGQRFSAEEIQARIGAGPSRRDGRQEGAVAVMPVYGVITPKADLMSEISGGSSIDRLRDDFATLVADPQIAAIVLDVNSPGGSVPMVHEFASEIRKARGSKPIVAVANHLAGSAAYWLGSQADEFVGTPSAHVGSIGVLAVHEEASKLAETVGIQRTVMRAGKHKAAANPWEPLSDEARADIQARIDDAYAMFTLDVAKGRGVPVDSVRSGYGEGRILSAKQALSEGMLDRIDTLEAVVNGLQRTSRSAAANGAVAVTITGTTTNLTTEAAARGLSFADQSFQLREGAEALVERLASLAEVERGRLTAAKRESLLACPGALREAAQSIEDVLAATDPDRHRKAVLAEVARFEARRATAQGGAL